MRCSPIIMQCMEATFDRTADDEKTIRAAIDCFIELWMGQVEWEHLEEHLEDEDYDDEAAEIEARSKLRDCVASGTFCRHIGTAEWHRANARSACSVRWRPIVDPPAVNLVGQ
jgi:hypothetical protein